MSARGPVVVYFIVFIISSPVPVTRL